MPFADPQSPAALESMRASRRRHYHANKAPYIARARARDAELRAVTIHARSVPCMDCEQVFEPYQMDFDHRPGTGKIDTINAMVRDGVSITTLLAEMAKCDVVCANCHRARTWRRNKEIF